MMVFRKRSAAVGVPMDGMVSRVRLQGAKNAVLPLLYAAVALGGRTRLLNAPSGILDFHSNVKVLRSIGAHIDVSAATVDIRAEELDFSGLDQAAAARTRYSSLLMGLAQARGRRLQMALPGGCSFGRPLDIHFDFFRASGATLDVDTNGIRLHPGSAGEHTFRLRFPSVGASINALIASACSANPVVLENLSVEPEVLDVVQFLANRGVDIRFHSERVLRLCGPATHGLAIWPIMPDRIEAMTLVFASILARRRLCLVNVRAQDLMAGLEVLGRMNVPFSVDTTRSEVVVYGDRCGAMKPCRVTTSPHPGFPTDLHPVLAAVLSTVAGTSMIEEAVMGERFAYMEQLAAVGARLRRECGVVRLDGDPALRGCRDMVRVQATDIRGGMAALLLGLTAARQEVHLEQHEQVLRGYQDLGQIAQLFDFEQGAYECATST